MTGRMNGSGAETGKRDFVSLLQPPVGLHRLCICDAEAGATLAQAIEQELVSLMRPFNRHAKCRAQFVSAASMIYVAMGEKNLLNAQPQMLDGLLDRRHISAGIDNCSCFRFIIENKRAILLERGDGNDMDFKLRHGQLLRMLALSGQALTCLTNSPPLSGRMISASNRANLIAAIATIASCDMALGFTLQLLPLLMERNGVPASVIGLNTAMAPLGILLAGPFLPGIIRRFGTRPVVYCAVAFDILALFIFKSFPSLYVWFPLRFMFGIASGALFTVSEAWVLSFSDEGSRGRVMGLYTSVMAVSFSLGPIMLPFTGTEGWLPWVIAACCLAASTIPLAFVKASDDVFRNEGGGKFWPVVRSVPLLLFAVGCATLFDSVFISFFSIFGLRSGLTLETASMALGIGILGNLLFQFLIGWLADKWSSRGVVVLSAAITVVTSVALIWVVNSALLWPVIIILSTSAFAVYIVALAIVAGTFKGGDLVACSAAFSMMWGLGGLVGPPLAGAAIDAYGINAMPVTLACFYVVLLAGLAFTGGRLVTRAKIA